MISLEENMCPQRPELLVFEGKDTLQARLAHDIAFGSCGARPKQSALTTS